MDNIWAYPGWESFSSGITITLQHTCMHDTAFMKSVNMFSPMIWAEIGKNEKRQVSALKIQKGKIQINYLHTILKFSKI